MKRKDVSLKSLLRKIKKFFWIDFQCITMYNEQKKNKGDDYYEKCLRIYIEIVFQEQATPEFVFILGSFISSKDMKNLIDNKSNSSFIDFIKKDYNITEVNKIYNTLYKFRLQNLEAFLRKECAQKLMHYFYKSEIKNLKEDELIGLQIVIDKIKIIELKM